MESIDGVELCAGVVLASKMEGVKKTPLEIVGVSEVVTPDGKNVCEYVTTFNGKPLKNKIRASELTLWGFHPVNELSTPGDDRGGNIPLQPDKSAKPERWAVYTRLKTDVEAWVWGVTPDNYEHIETRVKAGGIDTRALADELDAVIARHVSVACDKMGGAQ